MISPDELTTKAQNAYRRFLAAWVKGEDAEFFPLHIPANLELIKGDLAATIKAVEMLRDKAKAVRGWGYTVHWKQVQSRDLGRNSRPDRITIDTREDLLRLTGKATDFGRIQRVVRGLRQELPRLEDWIVSNVKSIAALEDSLEGLIAITQYFLKNPWPDCYARQIPVPVDTKFVERHQSVLQAWLNLLLPASAINVNETRFSLRFGLRDGQPHRALRLLDPCLLEELKLAYDELSLPLRALATLPVRNTTVVIVENRLNLLTLPLLPRAIGIEGEGKAVVRLEKLNWLHENRLVYWGDIDVDGFRILSALRNLFPGTESIMMDQETLQHHQEFVISGNGSSDSNSANLTECEAAVFHLCREKNLRLEQERIIQEYANQRLSQWTKQQLDSGGTAE